MADRPLILIADDDPDLRNLVYLTLESFECDIIEANDGAKTLETIYEKMPDLVILDVMMPVLTGWEILRQIRTNPDKAVADIGVLMLTGIGESLNRMSSPMYGADDYIDKPFQSAELLFKVRRVISKARRRKAQEGC
ncbi:MAG: response regulator [Proteobacteria bacterium]|nr:response regulator [Pseudomonadota bacterium]